ncbi:MAG: DegV family protein [Thermodesulfobacteriota bacterium]
MDGRLRQAFVTGYECLVSWTDLLDQINVFPVADADTGRNLKISLAPLRRMNDNLEAVAGNLLRAATGNSGNIANRFLNELLACGSPADLHAAAKTGRDAARKAVVAPKPGTMLTVFDALAEFMGRQQHRPIPFEDEALCRSLIDYLQATVRSTTDMMPVLRDAGVVDAGALGMYIYLDGFFRHLADRSVTVAPVTEIFSGRLRIARNFEAVAAEGYCVDTLVKMKRMSDTDVKALSALGESVVVIPEESRIKIHLHTSDRHAARKAIESLGDVLQWSDEPLDNRVGGAPLPDEAAVHIMTDAAGSLTKEDARKYRMTLLDSYLVMGENCLPETLADPRELYAAMRRGVKVSTAQASVFERHQCYASALSRYRRVLYLCVGSVYTGNHDIATTWKMENDPEDRMTIIDSTAASGRLGMIALATARLALTEPDGRRVLDFAAAAIQRCEEYIFLERLKYLAAGGRLSKTSGFFGDLLHMKPIISPRAEGAQKAGVVKNRKEQVLFALEKLQATFTAADNPMIMLEYSDNRPWVAETVLPEITRRYPKAEILLQPLSLTSGAHMGPGTWGLAFLP